MSVPIKSKIDQMKIAIKELCLLPICLTLLLAVLVSCANQGHSSHDKKEVQAKHNNQSTEPERDMILRLEFTSMVRSIFEAANGDFWFGSDQEGVCRYDGKTFTYFSQKDGLSDNQVRTIQEDQNGHIWFATGTGVSSYDGEKITVHADRDNLRPDPELKKEWKKEANDLWFNRNIEGGRRGGGIFRYDGQNLSSLAFPVLDHDHNPFSINGTVTGICKGKNDMLWISSYGGVLGYDGKAFRFINEKGFDYHVRSIYEDSKGNLWIGNNGIGVLCYDGHKTIKLADKNGISMILPLVPYHVFTISEDRHGNIWFGDRDTGAWCYDGISLKNYRTEDGLPNLFLRVIYRDRKGDLWFGLEGGHVCKFNGETFDEFGVGITD